MMSNICGVMIQKPGMPEPRPCMNKLKHGSLHTPDLTGLENVYGYQKILCRGEVYISRNGYKRTTWKVADRYEDIRTVIASSLFSGHSGGIKARNRSGLGSKQKNGKIKPEYHTIQSHFTRIFIRKHPDHGVYKNMIFFDDWNPRKGGSFMNGVHWMKQNGMRKPSLYHQLHVIKSKKYPHGFFGPGGIVWRWKGDRHDQDLKDAIYDMPRKNLIELQKEIVSVLKEK